MKKIGFIGAGNMATAIISGLISQSSDNAAQINLFDTDSQKRDAAAQLGVNVCNSGCDTVINSDIVVLAVKPQNYAEVLEEIKPCVNESKTFVSIAAGISISYVQKALCCQCPVMRVMPNTPLLLKKGATALCPSKNLSDEDNRIIFDMFSKSGVCEYIEEEHMNEIISVNGSSPAYIYLFAKAMADYAESKGISYDKALNLVCASFEGAAAMLMQSGESADELIKKVSSKGGTTIAALERLEKHGFYNAVQDAMEACTKRAEELGK